VPRPGFPSTDDPVRFANSKLAESSLREPKLSESRLADSEVVASSLSEPSTFQDSRSGELSPAEMSLAPTTHTLDEGPSSRRFSQAGLRRSRPESTSRFTTWGSASAVIGVPAVLMLSATLLIPSESLEVSVEGAPTPRSLTAPEFESAAFDGAANSNSETDPSGSAKAMPTRTRPRADAEANVRSGRRGFSPVRERPEEQVRAEQPAPAPPPAPAQKALTGSMPSPFVLKAMPPATAPARPVAEAPPSPAEAPAHEAEDPGPTNDPSSTPQNAEATESPDSSEGERPIEAQE